MQRETREIELFVSKKRAVIRETDGDTDDILVQPGKRMHEMIPEYLAAVTVSIGDKTPVTPDDILDLLVPDQEFLAIEIAKLTNDDEPIIVRDECDDCPDDPVGIGVDLAELHLRQLPEGAEGPDPVFEIFLPRSNQLAAYGYLTGRQEMALLRNLVNGQIDASRSMYDRLRSLGGVAKPELKLRHVRELRGRDRSVLREAMDNYPCGYDGRVSWRCARCGKIKVINLLSHMGFFFPRAKVGSGTTSSSARAMQ